MDVLTDVLDNLRLQGTLYFSTELGRSWGIRVPAFEAVARFHLVIRGQCWVQVSGTHDPVRLETGDLALVPHGAEHVLSDRPSAPARSVDEVVEAAGFDGRGALVYGTPLEDLMHFVAREVREGRPGHEAVARRLSEVIFVQTVRFWAQTRGEEPGILAALADPGLASALQGIHAEPERSWTLDALARRAHMGRTTFAERFRDTVGTTPADYLTRWRMQKARRLLAESTRPIARVASDVGYDSSAAFSRAFKREVGSPPARYRRERTAG